MLSNNNLYGDVMVTLVLFIFHKEPASEDFELTNSGGFKLKRHLNYNLVQKYSFTVKAEVSETVTPNCQHKEYER